MFAIVLLYLHKSKTKIMENLTDKPAIKKLEQILFSRYPGLIKDFVEQTKTLQDIIESGHWEGEEFYFYTEDGEIAFMFNAYDVKFPRSRSVEYYYGWNSWDTCDVEYDTCEEAIEEHFGSVILAMVYNSDQIVKS